jgi:hypothetical protein
MNRLWREFLEFDAANPHVWELFERFAFEAIEAGHETLSASLICERIRWETTVVTTDTEFKLNNNHRAYYARKFNSIHQNIPQKFVLRYVPELDGTESEVAA